MAKDEIVFQVTESQFSDAVVEMAQRLGWEVWHDNDSRRNDPGLPDLLCVHPIHGCCWLELKTMRGRLRPAQSYWLDLLNRAGQRAYMVRPSDMDFLESVFRGDPMERDNAA